MHTDIYQKVTDSIVAQLEKGTRPWAQPWKVGAGGAGMPLRVNGIPYRGINVLILWSEATTKGYKSQMWMTYKQAAALHAHVRKGEKGTMVVYYNTVSRNETDSETGEETEHHIPILREYWVFNCDQIDGLPAKFAPMPDMPTDDLPEERNADVEAFFANLGAKVSHGGGQAFYMPSEDRIQMPEFKAFKDAESYYSTLGHEHIHWTKTDKRLDRDLGKKRWGDEGYAMEELVAEMGAAFLCATLGITSEPRADHAQYLASWLRVLKGDKKAIFGAASYAQKAVDYLESLQPQALQVAA